MAAPCARLQLVRGPVRIGVSGRPFNGIVRAHQDMSRALSAYLAIEIVSIILYVWALWIWSGWKSAPTSTFAGSPDANYLYVTAAQSHSWAAGLLVGVSIGAVLGLFLSRHAAISNRPFSMGAIASVIVPIVVLICGELLGASGAL